MKKTTIKNTWVTASLLVAAVGYTTIASAHDKSGALGTGIGATDYYQITCSNDGHGNADHLALQLRDLAPVAAPVISAQVTKATRAGNTTDQVDGDALASPEINLKGGNGAYYVIINKSKAGSELYTFNYHCETLGNVHTGTSIFQLQNQ